jgi:hypothetical protein
MSLNKDSILAAADLPTEKVPCPEWGGDVYVRTMAGTERDHFEQTIADGKKATNLNNVRARLAVKTVCDEKGNRLFSDDDADALGKKSGKVLDRIFDAAQRLNGIGDKAVEEIAKNSDAAPSGNSSSSSPVLHRPRTARPHRLPRACRVAMCLQPRPLGNRP